MVGKYKIKNVIQRPNFVAKQIVARSKTFKSNGYSFQFSSNVYCIFTVEFVVLIDFVTAATFAKYSFFGVYFIH